MTTGLSSPRVMTRYQVLCRCCQRLEEGTFDSGGAALVIIDHLRTFGCDRSDVFAVPTDLGAPRGPLRPEDLVPR